MPLLVNSVPNLAQGVSQQPDNLRYPGQCDEQINAWATVVEGLKKRPNTNYVKNIDSTSTSSNIFTHFVKRDETNQYVLTVSLGGVGVTNLADGTQYPVSISSTASKYLSLGTSVTNPLQDLRALTVADYTFLVNKKRKVLKDANSLSSVPEKEALIAVKLGDYEKGYSIYVDDVLIPLASTIASNPHSYTHHGHQPATYISGPSGSTGNGKYADTEYIAQDLAECLTESLATGRTGITDITFSDGGSGWLEDLVVIKTGKTRGVPITYPSQITTEPTELNFTVRQDSPDPNNPGSTFVNESAKGFCTVTAGQITGFVFTHQGNYYDSGTSTTIKLTQRAYVDGKWLFAAGNTPTSPATITPTISTIEPFVVERQGSIIKLKKTKNVSNGGSYYLLLKDHVSNADTEPGVGQAWENFWELTTSTAGATSWVTGTNYSIGTDFEVRTTDGLNNQGVDAIYKEVNSITDLPKDCFDGFRVKIKGDADIAQDDYFVRFTTDNKNNFGKGSWVETVGWKRNESDKDYLGGIETRLDYSTMPIVLVVDAYDAQGTIVSFTLKTPQEDEEVEAPDEIGWKTRQAGDDITNPFPSFTDSTINDVFFFKNRLGFLTDSNVVFSEADEYFNFFRTTTQQLLDSAPIDVGLSHTKVAILQHAIPFQEKLMLFSKQSQFVLRGADVLSPKTVAISPVTEFDISDSVEPVALGNYIYFTFKRNEFEGMYEYFVDNNTEVFDAEEVTQQVPKYIPNNVRKIAGSQAENTLVVSVDDPKDSTNTLKTLYVYKYFWSNKEKIQSAWMKFTFDRDVVGFDFIDSQLYMITKDTEGLHLEFLTLEDGLKDEGLDYSLLLDSRLDGTEVTVAAYDTSARTTRISNIPYNVSLGTDIELYTKIGTQRAITMVDNTTVDVTGTLASYVNYEGTIYKCETTHTAPSSFVAVDTSVTPNVTYWSVSTDVTSAPTWSSGNFYNNDKYFVIGKPYNMLYRFSDQSLKQPTERGGRSASDYTYQTIRSGSINYADTGHFTVEVTPEYRDTYSYVFNPDIVGADLSLNEFEPQNGHFRFPVQAQPGEVKIEVKSDSALPCKLLAAEFESMFVPRSRRYGS